MSDRPSVFGAMTEILQQPQQPETKPEPVVVPEAPERTTIKTSTYLPIAVHDTLRDIAHTERKKIHDLIVEGIEEVLAKRRYPSFDELRKRK